MERQEDFPLEEPEISLERRVWDSLRPQNIGRIAGLDPEEIETLRAKRGKVELEESDSS